MADTNNTNDISKKLVFGEDNKKHYFVNANGLTAEQLKYVQEGVNADRISLVFNEEEFQNQASRTSGQEHKLNTNQKVSGGHVINVGDKNKPKGKDKEWAGTESVNPKKAKTGKRVAVQLGEMEPVVTGVQSLRKNYWDNRPISESDTQKAIGQAVREWIQTPTEGFSIYGGLDGKQAPSPADVKATGNKSGVYNIGGGKKFAISQAEMDFEALKDNDFKVDINDNSNYNWTPEEIRIAEAIESLYTGGEKIGTVVKDTDRHGGTDWVSKTDKYNVSMHPKYKSLWSIAKEIYGKDMPEKIEVTVPDQKMSLKDAMWYADPTLATQTTKTGWQQYDPYTDPAVVSKAEALEKTTIQNQFIKPKESSQQYVDNIKTARSNTVDALDLFEVYERGKASGFKDKFGRSNLWLGTDRKAKSKATLSGFGTEDGKESQVIGDKIVHEDGVNDKLLKYINQQTGGSYASLDAVPTDVYSKVKGSVKSNESATRYPGLVGYDTLKNKDDVLMNRYLLRDQIANSNLIGDYVALGKRAGGNINNLLGAVGSNNEKNYKDAFVFSNDTANAGVRFSQPQYWAPKKVLGNFDELLNAVIADNSSSTKKANKTLKKPTTQADLDSAEKIEARNKAAQQKRMKEFKLWKSLPENKGKTLADYDKFTQEQTREQGTGRL